VRSLLSRILGRRRPASGDSPCYVAGFVVYDRETGRAIHAEYHTSPEATDRFADRTGRRLERLERKYPHARYEIEQGFFNSLDAFFQVFPDARELTDPKRD
jgi:hypothetical protein